ncbi:MAG: diguanylate cyclase [Campylobacterota bacterium]|nr:diguanylate cyclase [Campylobacterota bacterium]
MQEQRDTGVTTSELEDPTSDLEIFSNEVLAALIRDNLPPTPNNFGLYFDRLLEEKSSSLRRQIKSILELEENNDEETSIELEKSLKKGFSSIKNILQVSATLYKNMALMTKVLEKTKSSLTDNPEHKSAMLTVNALENDINKLNGILKKQITHMKDLYSETADIVKNVENETIFDNRYGIHNKRYLLTKLTQEIKMVVEFKHKSSFLAIELADSLKAKMDSEKSLFLVTRTIAKLLMKTSRRSDIVAHFENGIFMMILKHTDLESAKKAADRLFELIDASNFFLGEKEIHLKSAIGVAEVLPELEAEEILVHALDAMAEAGTDDKIPYIVYSEKRH